MRTAEFMHRHAAVWVRSSPYLRCAPVTMTVMCDLERKPVIVDSVLRLMMPCSTVQYAYMILCQSSRHTYHVRPCGNTGPNHTMSRTFELHVPRCCQSEQFTRCWIGKDMTDLQAGAVGRQRQNFMPPASLHAAHWQSSICGCADSRDTGTNATSCVDTTAPCLCTERSRGARTPA